MKTFTPFICQFCKKTFFSHDQFRKHLIRHRRKYRKTGLIGWKGVLTEEAKYHVVQSIKKVQPIFATSQQDDESEINPFLPYAHANYTHVLASAKPYISMRNHVALHVNEVKPYQCEICLKSFRYNRYLTRHIKMHLKVKPFKCEYCDKGFTQKQGLIRHIRTHTKEKPYECEICRKCFVDHASINVHRRTHFKDKPYKCEYCDIGFTQKQSLDRHIRTHTKEKPYPCGLCEKRFADNASLNGHLRTHFKEKPFQCQYCPKCFTDRRNLKQHIRTHTKEKPYQCSYCQKSFAQSGSVKRHVKATHEKQKTVDRTVAKSSSYGAILAHLAANIEHKQVNMEKNHLYFLNSLHD